MIDSLLNEIQLERTAGHTERALALALEATQQAPHRLDLWLQLATLQSMLTQHDEAVRSFDRMLAQLSQPLTLRAHVLALRAQTLLTAGRWSGAAEGADAAAAIKNRDAATEHLIGSLYSRVGQWDKATRHLEAAVVARPRDASVLYSRGALHRFLGQTDAARELFERAIVSAPFAGQIHLTLAHLTTWRPDSNHCARLVALLERSEPRPADRISLHFAAHKEFHDVGDYVTAWHHLVSANTLAAREWPWIEDREAANFAAIRHEFPLERLRTAERRRGLMDTPGQPRPIFIVGLPRSGSTLVDRILCAHSAVESLGELPILGAMHRRYRGAPADIGAAYRREIRLLNSGRQFVIDKLPGNYRHIGLIKEALPEAIIVVTRRQPMDVLFGAYRMHLGPEYPWSYSLNALTSHHRQFTRLMSHWSDGLADHLIEVQHEALVRNPTRTIRGLLNRCGLPEEAACFEPHKNTAASTTASALQVREPISDRGFDAWKPYANQLKALCDTLNRDRL